MTIDQAIKLADTLKPNQYPKDMKVLWLSQLDGQIFAEVLATHEDCPMDSFTGYEEASGDTPLMVPYPFGQDIYKHFLHAQIDKENGEMTKYNQNITLYTAAFRAYANHYNCNHRPKAAGRRFRF